MPFEKGEVMSAATSFRLAAVLLLLGGAAGLAQAPDAKDKKAAEQIVRLQNLLEQSIETEKLQKPMSLAELLAAVEKQLPRDRKVSFRFDEKAFGKELAAVKATQVKLPPFPRRVSLNTLIRMALFRIVLEVGDRPDYLVLPTHVLITTMQHTVSTRTYDVGDVVQLSKCYPSTNPLRFLGVIDKAAPKPNTAPDAATLLVQLIYQELAPGPWPQGIKNAATIRVVNGTKLVVETNRDRHELIANLLAALRRLGDLAVVMNARLYEVDRAFYGKHVAPLLPKAVNGKQNWAVPVTVALWQQLEKLKPFEHGSDVKIKPGKATAFLSVQFPYRYVTRFGKPDKINPVVNEYDTGLSGVAFRARVEVSPDRRAIRLHLIQDVAQLAGITKAKMLNLKTGQVQEREVPAVRTAVRTGFVEIDDGTTILMPVDYQPAAKDRVWLMVAEPRIYIEEEEEQIRKAGPQPVPKGKVKAVEPAREKGAAKDPDERPPAYPPRVAGVEQLLQTALTDALTNPKLKTARAVYGTPASGKFALANENWAMAWPRWFHAAVPGHQQRPVHNEKFGLLKKPMLGISLERVAFGDFWPFEIANVQFYLFNAGGHAGGFTDFRGCRLYYLLLRVDQRWVVLQRVVDWGVSFVEEP